MLSSGTRNTLEGQKYQFCTIQNSLGYVSLGNTNELFPFLCQFHKKYNKGLCRLMSNRYFRAKLSLFSRPINSTNGDIYIERSLILQ